jgi:hypothetical protein
VSSTRGVCLTRTRRDELQGHGEVTGDSGNSLRLRKHYATLVLREKLASLDHGMSNETRGSMKRTWILRAVRTMVFVAVAILITGAAVIVLWNALVPEVVGGAPITRPRF